MKTTRGQAVPHAGYQRTHRRLFDPNCMHIEKLGGEISAPEIQNRRLMIGCFPWKVQGGVVACDGEWPKDGP